MVTNTLWCDPADFLEKGTTIKLAHCVLKHRSSWRKDSETFAAITNKPTFTMTKQGLISVFKCNKQLRICNSPPSCFHCIATTTTTQFWHSYTNNHLQVTCYNLSLWCCGFLMKVVFVHLTLSESGTSIFRDALKMKSNNDIFSAVRTYNLIKPSKFL